MADNEVTNKMRAKWAGSALLRFAEITGMVGEEPDLIAQDFLTDLLHYCDQKQINGMKVMANAVRIYSEEVREERER